MQRPEHEPICYRNAFDTPVSIHTDAMPIVPADTLLDPKNDYVFFRVFSEEPDLLVDLLFHDQGVEVHHPSGFTPTVW